jgi:hypothetical protein
MSGLKGIMKDIKLQQTQYHISMKDVELLKKMGVYYELVFNGKHCYKCQLPDIPIIIITADTKEKAASEMIKELKIQGAL